MRATVGQGSWGDRAAAVAGSTLGFVARRAGASLPKLLSEKRMADMAAPNQVRSALDLDLATAAGGTNTGDSAGLTDNGTGNRIGKKTAYIRIMPKSGTCRRRRIHWLGKDCADFQRGPATIPATLQHTLRTGPPPTRGIRRNDIFSIKLERLVCGLPTDGRATALVRPLRRRWVPKGILAARYLQGGAKSPQTCTLNSG